VTPLVPTLVVRVRGARTRSDNAGSGACSRGDSAGSRGCSSGGDSRRWGNNDDDSSRPKRLSARRSGPLHRTVHLVLSQMRLEAAAVLLHSQRGSYLRQAQTKRNTLACSGRSAIAEDKVNIIVFKGDTEERTDSDPPIVLHYSISGSMDRSSGSLVLIEQEHTVGTSATYNLQCNPGNPVF
jgi:hypothetical protein